MSNKSIQKSNLFFFTGENTVDLNRELNRWMNEFKKKHQEVNLERYADVEQHHLRNLIPALESAPFLADKRMIVIKGLPPSTEDMNKLELDPLIDALENVSETTLIIFVSPKPDKRTKLFKKLTESAIAKDFPLLRGAELTRWVLTEIQRKGGKIDTATAQHLISYSGEEISTLKNEVEKLLLYKKNEPIGQSDIFNVCSMNSSSNIFHFTGSIGGEDLRTLHYFQKLLEAGEPLQLIFFMIVRQFRYLIQARYLLDRRASKSEIQSQLRLSPFQVSAFMSQARLWTYDELKKIYTELMNIDIGVKVGKIPSSSDGEKVLRLVIEKFLICTKK